MMTLPGVTMSGIMGLQEILVLFGLAALVGVVLRSIVGFLRQLIAK
jgi:hypothetical protein